MARPAQTEEAEAYRNERRRERAHMDQAIIKQLRKWGEHQIANFQQHCADGRGVGPFDAYRQAYPDDAPHATVREIAAWALKQTLSHADEYFIEDFSEEPPEDWGGA